MDGREEFRLDRVRGMQDVSDALLPDVEAAFRSGDPAEALRGPLEKVFRDEFGAADGKFGLFDGPGKAWDWFWGRVKPALDRVKDSSDPRVVADWLGTAVLNGARVAAADRSSKVWLSRRDGRVRPTHVDADGQTKSWSDPFVVCGGVEMMFPGDPVGDPSCWINCRCVAAPASLVSSVSEVVAMADVQQVDGPKPDVVDPVDPEDKVDQVDPADAQWDDGYVDDEDIIPFGVPWHGVLVVEGTPTGDKREFEAGALSWEEPPLHLRWQEQDTSGHDGAVVVGSIDEIWRDGDRIMGQGMFSDSASADAAVGALMDGDTGGVSIDVDQGELSSDSAEGATKFSLGRIRGATMVHIPAFVEAAVKLGPAPDGPKEPVTAAGISEEPWDGSASRFTPDQWRRACIVHLEDSMSKSAHKLPILEPDGTLSRAAVHAAAGRIGQTDAPPAELAAARGRLRSAYRRLGEDPPDSLTASGGEFARGPGWVTNPEDTRRIHHYWTKGAGARKIRWGTPGDFRRLRRHLAKFINPLYLNRTVAQWHHDALGYWPGELGKPGNPPATKENRRRAARHAASADPVTAAALKRLPYEWFTDPGFDAATPLTVEEDGRVYGHLAKWGVCHIGITGRCVTAPGSKMDYAAFRTGAVLTDNGRVSVGHITLGTGHASLEDAVDARAATAHYDNTGTVVADVAAGEDDFGIWVAGAVRDGITDEQLHALQAGALSGDWRGIDGNLELVAALVVNVPGFPVQRPALAAAAAVGISPVLSKGQRIDAVRAAVNAERVAALSALL
jgi:hypothetical protein